MLELPQTGSAIPYPLISTMRMYSYVGSRALFRLLLELTFVAFTVFYIVTEIRKCRKVVSVPHSAAKWSVLSLADPGAAPLSPKIFSKPCSFQAILRDKPIILGSGPPWGKNSAAPP